MSEPKQQDENRTDKGTFAKGVSGNPGGRPAGSIDRVKAVEDAICAKAQLEGQAGVVKWLKSLPDSMLAPLWARLLPKESHVKATITWEDVVAAGKKLEDGQKDDAS